MHEAIYELVHQADLDPVRINCCNEVLLLVVVAFPPSPTTMAAINALFPPAMEH